VSARDTTPSRGGSRAAAPPIRSAAPVEHPALAIRPERAADREAVFALVCAAFERDDEARLVDRLRAAGAACVSLVAERGGEIVGHVLFSPVHVRAGGRGRDAVGLAPLAVLPSSQRAGVGDALVREGLEACRAAGHALVFVLGHPSYYPRFGFERAAARGLAWEQSGHEAAFFVLELEPGAWTGRRGVVSYHPAFDQV